MQNNINVKVIISFLLILLLIFLIGCGGVVPSPSTKGNVSGRVMIPEPTTSMSREDISGYIPLSNATVTVTDSEGVTHTVITDENGYYNIPDVAPGTNYIITATETVDGNTVVYKDVVPEILEGENCDAGTADETSTALALVVETLLDEGVVQEEIDLEEIQNSTNFETTVEEVSAVLAENGDVTTDSNVNNAVESTTEEIIENTNYSPDITSVPIITATVGIEYVYDVEATDPNGDSLNYSLVIFPDGMTIDSSTGVISWTPIVDQIGNCEVSIEVSDGELFATQNFTITVNPGSTTTPNIKLNPSTQTLTQGSQFTLSVVVENVTDLLGASVTLNFDAAKLQYVSSSAGSFIPNATLMDSSAGGSVILDVAGMGASSCASGTGTIITVVFDTIASGNTNITFGATDLRDENNDSITHTTGSGCLVTIN